MIKRYPLFILILCISNLSFGQVHKGFQWISPDHSLFKIDIKSGTLSQETPNKPIIKLGEIQNWESIKTELPGDFEVNAFYRADSTLITIPGTGQVYSLHLPNLKLKRLDQTFFRGYNFNATQFLRNDTLFSIGGDGFWLEHSVITFYNPKTFEWALYKLENNNKEASNNEFSGYSTKHDKFFTASIKCAQNLKQEEIPLFEYSFKKEVWEKKGILNNSITQFAKGSFRSIWSGQYLVLIHEVNDYKIYIIDPFNNVLYEFLSTDDQFFMLNCELYFQNNKLYSRSFASSGKVDKIFFDSLSVDSIIKQSTKIGQVYEEDQFNNKNLGIAAGTLLVFLFSFLYYRKRVLKNEDYTLTSIELLLVKKFINQPIGVKITSYELNNLLDINNKSYDNQRQIRYRIIGSINQKLLADLNAKELVFRSSNIEDKRMMDYYINPEIKAKDLEKLMKTINL
jgi:hypothetical protein